jgi:Holliday junction resolvase RusA-like endonuclease
MSPKLSIPDPNMTLIERYFVPCVPFGKERPRMGKHSVFTPQKTIKFEQMLWESVKAQMKPNTPNYAQPLGFKVLALFPIPKSYSAKKRAACHMNTCTTKPDGDNILKIVQDALTNIRASKKRLAQERLLKDDCKIAFASVDKRYHETTHGIEIEIYTIH